MLNPQCQHTQIFPGAKPQALADWKHFFHESIHSLSKFKISIRSASYFQRSSDHTPASFLNGTRFRGTLAVLTVPHMGLWSTRCPLTSSGHEYPTLCPWLWLVPPSVLVHSTPRVEVPGAWLSSMASSQPLALLPLWKLLHTCTSTWSV